MVVTAWMTLVIVVCGCFFLFSFKGGRASVKIMCVSKEVQPVLITDWKIKAPIMWFLHADDAKMEAALSKMYDEIKLQSLLYSYSNYD